MSGRYEEGWDAFPAGASLTDIVRIMQDEGWWFPAGTSPVGLSIQAPGRYGYGGRLFTSFNPIIAPDFLAIKLTGGVITDGWISAGLSVGLQANAEPEILFYDTINNRRIVSIRFEVFGVVSVYTGGDGGQTYTLLGKSAQGQFLTDEDFDVECYCKVAGGTSGEVQVRIHTLGNGGTGGPTPAIHLINVNTDPGGVGGFTGHGFGWQALNGSNSSQTYTIDDYRHYDSAGTINNSWLGTSRVQSLLAAGNGATINFTRSNTGVANWQNIINKNVDDTLYLYDPTVGDVNLSTLTSLVNSPTVFWVGVTAFVRQDDATQRFVKNRLISGGVTVDGPSFATPMSYVGNHSVTELDPATGLQFTGAAVNLLTIGVLVFA